MALSDPQSITLGGVQTLPRTAIGQMSSTYSKADGTLRLELTHTVGKRKRHTARVRVDKIAADPLITTTNVRLSASAYLVIDAPDVGFTVTELSDLVASLTLWFSSNVAANTIKLLGGES